MNIQDLSLVELFTIFVAIQSATQLIINWYNNSKKIRDKIIEPSTTKIDELSAKIDETSKKTDAKIDEMEKSISKKMDKMEYESCKTFLVSTISEIKRADELGQGIDEVLKKRFFERYDKYIASGGNTYVKHEVERLQKEGII